MDVATAKRILEQALAGQMQDDWQVYRAKRSYLTGEAAISCGIVLFLLSLIAVGIAVTITTPGGFPPDVSIKILFGALLVLIVGTSVGFGWRAVIFWQSIRTVKQQLLVITPIGFVARNGLRRRQTVVVAYERLEAVALVVQHSRYASTILLDFTVRPTTTDGVAYHLPWKVDPRFGTVTEIAQAIIAGQARYAAAHPVATAPRGEDAGVTSA